MGEWQRSRKGNLWQGLADGIEQHAVRRGPAGRYRWELRHGINRGGPHRVEQSLASYDTEAEAVADLLAALAERGGRRAA